MRLALAHRSYCAEQAVPESNERLEFLGDAVLGLVVTDLLYRSFADRSEGDLARIRAAVVSTEALAPIAEQLGVGSALLLGRGEEASGGRAKASLLADALEALIGAAYLDQGSDAVAKLVDRLVGDQISVEAKRPALGDAKNRLQELAARLLLPAPSYATTGRGPDHDRRFVAAVRVGTLEAAGEGRSKKAAERFAAQAAIEALAARMAGDGAGAP